MYENTTTETEEEHAEREGVDDETVETRWCKECNAEATDACVKHPAKVRVEVQALVCSCSFTTCPLVKRFGLARPVFQKEIRPIPSQMRRDMRALEIRRSAS